MVWNLLNAAVLSGAEGVLNNLIALDPAARRQLSALSGTLVGIESTSPAVNLSILVHENGLHLSSRRDAEADTVISGPASALLGLLKPAGGGATGFYDKGIQVRGSLEKARKLQMILAGLDVDWEYHLGKVVGDIPARGLGDTLGRGRQVFSDGYDSLLLDLEEYLHEEARLFPDKRELESFYASVDNLRLDVDRLAARVAGLSADLGVFPDPESLTNPPEGAAD